MPPALKYWAAILDASVSAPCRSLRLMSRTDRRCGVSGCRPAGLAARQQGCAGWVAAGFLSRGDPPREHARHLRRARSSWDGAADCHCAPVFIAQMTRNIPQENHARAISRPLPCPRRSLAPATGRQGASSCRRKPRHSRLGQIGPQVMGSFALRRRPSFGTLRPCDEDDTPGADTPSA